MSKHDFLEYPSIALPIFFVYRDFGNRKRNYIVEFRYMYTIYANRIVGLLLDEGRRKLWRMDIEAPGSPCACNEVEIRRTA